MRSEQQRHLHDSIVVSIPACHAGDRGSIPRRGVFFQSLFLSQTRLVRCGQSNGIRHESKKGFKVVSAVLTNQKTAF